jgi:RNA polymerase sigma-70 factor, ECF subfamily
LVRDLDKLSDMDLVRACLKRCMTCCDELVRRHAAAVNRYLRLKCGDLHLAEDITQDTFRKMHQNLKSFKGGSSLKTWLFTIAGNTYLDHVRKTGREGRQMSMDDCMVNPSLQLADSNPASNPYAQASRREQVDMLYSAINTELTSRQREVVLLQMQGLSYDEMTRVTGMEAGTVGKTLNDARKKLMQVLGPRLKE